MFGVARDEKVCTRSNSYFEKFVVVFICKNIQINIGFIE